jgi:hypothetical protein
MWPLAQSTSAWGRLALTRRLPVGQFVKNDRHGGCEDWIASIEEHIDVVVADVDGAPSPLGIARAGALVQNRVYLESRARQLLIPFTKEAGAWQLVVLDLGEKARRHDCEFLMRFVFLSARETSTPEPHVEIGFALFMPDAEEPLFVLSVEAAVGFPR